MADDDEAARKARADSLRQQMASLKLNQTKPAQPAEEDSETDSGVSDLKKNATNKETPAKESPREFVHRRMRELEKKN